MTRPHRKARGVRKPVKAWCVWSEEWRGPDRRTIACVKHYARALADDHYNEWTPIILVEIRPVRDARRRK